ncbi:hypothetical protein DMENIID0001_149300 [Sergentomyia squamirostris]
MNYRHPAKQINQVNASCSFLSVKVTGIITSTSATLPDYLSVECNQLIGRFGSIAIFFNTFVLPPGRGEKNP